MSNQTTTTVQKKSKVKGNRKSGADPFKSVVAKRRRRNRKNKRKDAMDVDRAAAVNNTTPQAEKTVKRQRKRRQNKKKQPQGAAAEVVDLKLPSASYNPFFLSPFTYEPTTPNPFVPCSGGGLAVDNTTTPQETMAVTQNNNHFWSCRQCKLQNALTRLSCEACGFGVEDDDMSL